MTCRKVIVDISLFSKESNLTLIVLYVIGSVMEIMKIDLPIILTFIIIRIIEARKVFYLRVE